MAKYYGVTPEDIINYPANKLSAETIGSYASPNIKAGTRLVVPGGTLPDYFASDTLLYYAAVEKLKSLPVGNAESYPAPRKEIIVYEVQPLDSIFSIAEQFGFKIAYLISSLSVLALLSFYIHSNLFYLFSFAY